MKLLRGAGEKVEGRVEGRGMGAEVEGQPLDSAGCGDGLIGVVFRRRIGDGMIHF